MYPSTPNFSTSSSGDAWYIRRILDENGQETHQEVCQTSGAFFLVPIRSRLRMDMITTRSSNPYVIDGVRYNDLDLIDRDFRYGSAWTRPILLGYNEYLNRRARAGVSNPFTTISSRSYFDTNRLTTDFLARLVEGGIGNLTMWNGRIADRASTVAIDPSAILPELGQSMGDLPPNPVTNCTHQSNIDGSYRPAERNGGLGMILLGMGLGFIVVSSMDK